MKKSISVILILIILIGGYFIFEYWQSKQTCPQKDPLGLYTNCKAQVTGDINDPLGILNN